MFFLFDRQVGLILYNMQNGEQEKLEVPPVNNGECYLDQKMLNIIFCQKLSTIVRGSVNTVIVRLFLSVQFCHLNSGCLKNAYLSLSLIYCKGELFLLCMSLHLVYTSRELIPGINRRNNVQIGRFFFGRDLVFSSCLFFYIGEIPMKYLLSQLTKMRLDVVILVLLSQFQFFFFTVHNVDVSLGLLGGGLLWYHWRTNGLWHNESETSRGNLHHFGTIRGLLLYKQWLSFSSHTDILRGHE